MYKLLPALAAFLLALPAQATPVPLEALLERVALDPAVLAAKSSHQADLEKQAMRKSESGARAFLGASTGHYRELNSANQIDDYYSRNANIGISYPLLGSLKRQLDALAQAQLDAQRSQLAIAVRQAEQQLTLRTSYANWWRAQQEITICSSLLPAARKAQKETADRLEAGWTRRSDATSLDQRWHVMVSRCDLAQQLQQNERSLLELLAQMPLPADAQAIPANLHSRIAPLDSWQRQLDGHPAVKDRQAELDHAQERKSPPWYNSIESSISLGLATEDRSGVSRYGNNVVAALNFSIPIDVGSHTRAARGEAVSRWRAARDQLLAEKRRLMLELAVVLRSHQQTLVALTDRQKQLTAANLRRKEQTARLDLENTDAIEQMQAAELAYFQARFDLVSTWHQLWLEQATLQIFVTDQQETQSLLGDATLAWPTSTGAQPARTATRASSATPAAKSQPSTNGNRWFYGTYIWNSHQLLNNKAQASELAALQTAGFTRLYVGLDANQVARLQNTRNQLQQLVKQATQKNMQVFILLGEPLWMKPEHRQDLLSLIKSLSSIPFAGLHLDLEVEQLGWPVPQELVEQWMDTLAAAKRASPWPLEISSHYRWFMPDAPTKTCVPCALVSTGVQGVSLMIYTNNIDRSTTLVTDIARRWPKLHVRLAQSVEPELASSESWAHRSDTDIQKALAHWKTALKPANIGGIDWQDWHYFHKQGLALP